MDTDGRRLKREREKGERGKGNSKFQHPTPKLQRSSKLLNHDEFGSSSLTISLLVFSTSTLRFLKTRPQTPSSSCSKPSKRCSVPTYVCLNALASFAATANTLLTGGVYGTVTEGSGAWP